MRRLCTFAAPLAVATLVSAPAWAHDPALEGQPGFNRGPYLTVGLPTPGAWGFAGRQWSAESESIFQTGLAVGYLGGRAEGFKWAAGANLRYTALPAFDVMGEVRLGAGTPRTFGYAVFGLGPGVLAGSFSFSHRIGAGLQFAIWRRITLGAELDFENAWALTDSDLGVWTFTPNFLFGWQFGVREDD